VRGPNSGRNADPAVRKCGNEVKDVTDDVADHFGKDPRLRQWAAISVAGEEVIWLRKAVKTTCLCTFRGVPCHIGGRGGRNLAVSFNQIWRCAGSSPAEVNDLAEWWTEGRKAPYVKSDGRFSGVTPNAAGGIAGQ
jgi:hypothetical protein